MQKEQITNHLRVSVTLTDENAEALSPESITPQ